MDFTPDYRHLLDAVQNRRPARLPLYEHNISAGVMARVLGEDLPHGDGDAYFRQYCRFWKEMTYDTVTFEACVCGILPGGGAILGGRPGPIQSRADFEHYPWDDLPRRWWEHYGPQFENLVRHLPEGMQAVGGVGNGIFEISEDLVGYEWLCLMLADDPQLVADLYRRIGDVLCLIWEQFLARYGRHFCVCRMGDDLGFKSATLVSPAVIRRHILPQYRRVISTVHAAGKPFLLHSCGCIFPVMDDLIACGIDAKHSNEDQIAPYGRWIDAYGGRIGLLGGIDLDHLCRRDPAELTPWIAGQAAGFRRQARGYALGSGNSIPDYVPVAGYLAMVTAAQQVRAAEVSAAAAA